MEKGGAEVDREFRTHTPEIPGNPEIPPVLDRMRR